MRSGANGVTRRGAMAGLSAAGLGLSLAPSARALENLEITAPAAPGGGYDRTARAIEATVRGEKLGSATVINVGGAGGAIGLAQFVRNRRGSPSALIVGGLGMIASFATNKSKVTLADVSPVARLTSEYSVVVVPTASPLRTMADLVAKLKAGPTSVSWAGGSAGGADHVLAGLIARAVGVDPRQVNYVAFSGGGDSIAAIIGGQVVAGVGGASELGDQIKAGNVRALAISSEARVPGLDVPTLREQGIAASLANWRGIAAPPGITPAVRDAYVSFAESVVRSATWKTQLANNGWSDQYLAGDAFAAFVRQQTEELTQVLTQLGLVKA